MLWGFFIMNTNVKVFRMESEGGRGMYTAGACEGNELRDSCIHPAPRNDSKLVKNLRAKCKGSGRIFDVDFEITSYKFGFDSEKQLLRWIYKNEWLEGLNRKGIVLAIYECDAEDVIVGHTQTIFKNYISKTQHNILEYFNLKENI